MSATVSGQKRQFGTVSEETMEERLDFNGGEHKVHNGEQRCGAERCPEHKTVPNSYFPGCENRP